jgi:hypothetical protein
VCELDDFDAIEWEVLLAHLARILARHSSKGALKTSRAERSSLGEPLCENSAWEELDMFFLRPSRAYESSRRAKKRGQPRRTHRMAYPTFSSRHQQPDQSPREQQTRITEPDRIIIFRVSWEDDRGNVRVNGVDYTGERPLGESPAIVAQGVV